MNIKVEIKSQNTEPIYQHITFENVSGKENWTNISPRIQNGWRQKTDASEDEDKSSSPKQSSN